MLYHCRTKQLTNFSQFLLKYLTTKPQQGTWDKVGFKIQLGPGTWHPGLSCHLWQKHPVEATWIKLWLLPFWQSFLLMSLEKLVEDGLCFPMREQNGIADLQVPVTTRRVKQLTDLCVCISMGVYSFLYFSSKQIFNIY